MFASCSVLRMTSEEDVFEPRGPAVFAAGSPKGTDKNKEPARSVQQVLGNTNTDHARFGRRPEMGREPGVKNEVLKSWRYLLWPDS